MDKELTVASKNWQYWFSFSLLALGIAIGILRFLNYLDQKGWLKKWL